MMFISFPFVSSDNMCQEENTHNHEDGKEENSIVTWCFRHHTNKNDNNDVFLVCAQLSSRCFLLGAVVVISSSGVMWKSF